MAARALKVTLAAIVLCTIFFGAESFGHNGFSEGEEEELLEMPSILRTKEELVPYLERKGLRTVPLPIACTGNEAIADEVLKYQSTVNSIVQAATQGSFKGKTYYDVAEFVDKFGSRITGSDSLERSIDYVENILRKNGAANIQSEKVSVADWKRGAEIAKLMLPRIKDLHIVGLGQTAGTRLGGMYADAIVFNSYQDLMANLTKVKGKIAILNYGGPATNPLDTTNNGYNPLAFAGARAALYRSAATFSLYSPHARRANLYYDGVAPEIPIAYITFEDADLLTRIAARGERIHIYLNMQNTNTRRTTSRNVFGDLKGSQLPDEQVIFAAHVDSWDLAEAVQDDAIGVFLALEGLQLLNSLNLTPRRTLRFAFWTAEEYGYWGSAQYIKNHASEFDNLSAVLESDYSCLASTGLVFYGVNELACIAQQVLNLVGPAGTSGLLAVSPSMKSDVDNFAALNIPVVSLLGDDGRYFWFHHSQADAITAGSVNSTEFDRCLGLWTSTAYIIADLQNKIGRFPVSG